MGGLGGGISLLPAGEGGSGGGRPARAFTPRWGGGLGGGSPQAGSGAEPQPPVTSYDVIDDVNCKNFPLKFLQKRHFFTPNFSEFFSFFPLKFRKNLKNGFPLGILFLLCIEVVNVDFQLFNKVEGNPIAPLVFGIIALFAFMMGFVYAFPLSARYENTLFRTIKNSADIATRYFVRTLILFIIIAIEIALIFFNLTTMFIGLLIGPACIFLTISGFALPFFREIEKEPNAVTYLPNEADEDYKMPEETPEEMERQRKRRGKK